VIAAIHQPNFVPWLPFFQKVRQADLFVILTHCQYNRRAYQNRFNYRGHWYSMGVSGHRDDSIESRVYSDPQKDWLSIKRRLNDPSLLREMDELIVHSLVETNVAIIRHLMRRLHIETPIVFDYPTPLASTERLVDLCKHYGATTYLAGRSGGDYMNEKLFHDAGVEVTYQTVLPHEQIHVLECDAL